MHDHINITIPYHQDLTRSTGWTTSPESGRRYFVARFHYLLRSRQLPDRVHNGEVIDAFTVAPGMGLTRTETKEQEHTSTDMRASVEESLRENTSVLEFASSIAASTGLETIGRIAADVKQTTGDTLKSSFKDTFTVAETDTYRTMENVNIAYTIEPDRFETGTTVVAARSYKKHSYDLFLSYVDYLTVEYVGSPYGSIWLKRTKHPKRTSSSSPPDNVLVLRLPLASIQYWVPLPSASVMKESHYELEVEDPLEIFVSGLDRQMPYASVNPRPTLYDLAEQAFKPKQLAFRF